MSRSILDVLPISAIPVLAAVAGAPGGARGPSPGQFVPIGVDVLLDGILIGIAMTNG